MLEPIKSEKTLKAAEKNKYTFRTQVALAKPDIKRLAEKLFGVKVTKVQTAIMPGKSYRTGKRASKKTRPDWKKTIISVADGQKIDIYGA